MSAQKKGTSCLAQRQNIPVLACPQFPESNLSAVVPKNERPDYQKTVADEGFAIGRYRPLANPNPARSPGLPPANHPRERRSTALPAKTNPANDRRRQPLPRSQPYCCTTSNDSSRLQKFPFGFSKLL